MGAQTMIELTHALEIAVVVLWCDCIRYVAPGDASMLAQAELLCIDEAAAIPLPLVKKLFGPYLIFMSSTVTGYEGTGRSLSMKLVRDLRKRQANKSGPFPTYVCSSGS